MYSRRTCAILLTVVGLADGYTFSSVPYYGQGYQMTQLPQNFYQPRALPNYQPNDINRPILHPGLGMSPEYHNLVYKYVTDFAGTDQPPRVEAEEFAPRELQEQSIMVEEAKDESGDDKTVSEQEATTEGSVKNENDYFVPSDLILLAKDARGEFYGNFDAVKMRRMNFRSRPLTNPPLGGIVSDYSLLRTRPDYKNYVSFAIPSDDQQVSKRQTVESDDTDDTVVINAENLHNVKITEEEEEQQQHTRDQMMEENDEEEEQPAIAQSKPAAIALAGPGGVAQASPVGTALVGPGGLAVAAPSGTAVAGPAGQGVITSTADEKAKIVQKKIKEAWN